MTEKPDDIPQWAWDEADETTYDIDTDRYGSIEYTAARIGIARLVMRVRSQAFEECAKIAENYRANMSFWMSREWYIAKTASEHATQSISQAILQANAHFHRVLSVMLNPVD